MWGLGQGLARSVVALGLARARGLGPWPCALARVVMALALGPMALGPMARGLGSWPWRPTRGSWVGAGRG
jgi:hypothetical protein